LAIDEQSFGPEHPYIARDLNNLAFLLGATNRLAEAEPLMRRALAIAERSFGPAHPNVAVCLNNLASLLAATKRPAEAEPLMRRHVAIFAQFKLATGHDHPHFRDAIQNHREVLTVMGLSGPEIEARIGDVLGNEAER
ncbi:MAG: tetratricopeptide repeat protein, partial [Thermoguttaceae bacterium]|nr:tetratricopeptide repeat protein [Thermoguttaceae bacterium]